MRRIAQRRRFAVGEDLNRDGKKALDHARRRFPVGEDLNYDDQGRKMCEQQEPARRFTIGEHLNFDIGWDATTPDGTSNRRWSPSAGLLRSRGSGC